MCRAQTPGVKGGEKVPSTIPAPKAEPVVPPSPAKTIAQQLNDAFVSVFERVAPAVVIIDVTKKPVVDAEGDSDLRDFFFRQGPDGGGDTPSAPDKRAKAQSEGSGFIIQSGGYILTNNHVVKGAEKITVKLKDGRQFPAKLAGSDDKTDIAVVKIEAADLPVEELADSDTVRVGELACAIGVPYNLDYTFTTGVVSAKGRNKLDLPSTENYNYEDYIQTDASINPGNSGGPLVNLDGKVIGMNTLINGLNRGLGFAIPSNLLRDVGEQLIHNGRVIRPFIGVVIRSINEETQEQYGNLFNGVKHGVIVITIQTDTPAWRSDLRPEDVITEVDGVPVGTDSELQKQVLAKKVGSTVQLSVFRKGKTLKIAVTTSELPSDAARTAANPGETPSGESQRQEINQLYGMQLQDLTHELASNLGITAAGGVVVTSVADDSPAGRAAIQVKDVITAVDDRPVKDVASFKEVAKNGDAKRGIVCYLERPTGRSFVVIKVE